jgi:transcriptional regulator with XRE-family HTH domain
VEDILRLLGRRIREIRVKRGFASQEQFADYCGMHRTFLGHLETGRKDFRLTTIIRVAQSLGVTLQDLFAGLETGEPVKSSRSKRSGPDMVGLRRELATMERAFTKLKELSSPASEPSKTSSEVARKPNLKKKAS